MILLAGIISSCVSVPNINACKEKTPQRARCTETMTGVAKQVDDVNKLHGKSWWELRISNIQIPRKDYEELKKFIAKVCEKYSNACKEHNTDQILENIDKSF